MVKLLYEKFELDTLAGRITLSSMATEMGGIIGLIPPSKEVLAYAGHFIVLKRHEADGEKFWIAARHALGFCVLVTLSGWEASWQLKELLPEIRLARMLGWGVVPAALLAAAHYAARAQAWPLVTNRGAYLSLGAAPVALWAVVGLSGPLIVIHSQETITGQGTSPLTLPPEKALPSTRRIAAWWSTLAG